MKQRTKAEVSKDFLSGNISTIMYFDFHTLKKATKNFYSGNLLGRGGFGPVYQVCVISFSGIVGGSKFDEAVLNRENYRMEE